VGEVGDQIVKPTSLTHDAHQRLAWHGPGGGEDGRFDPEHPFAPAGGGGQVGELDVQAVCAVQPAAVGSHLEVRNRYQGLGEGS
jgi:hypothetical protein